MVKYFSNVNNLQELRKQYRYLLKKYHLITAARLIQARIIQVHITMTICMIGRMTRHCMKHWKRISHLKELRFSFVGSGFGYHQAMHTITRRS